jgi:hypothetical protein
MVVIVVQVPREDTRNADISSHDVARFEKVLRVGDDVCYELMTASHA